jgi:hypothetical protein
VLIVTTYRHMTRRIAASVFVIVMVLSLLLLIAGSIENAAKIQQQAMAQNSNSNSLSSTNNNNNNGILKSGPPEKITLEGQSKPPVLSPDKKQALEQDQAKIHHNPQLPSSDQPILGPILGTQAQ